MWKLYLKSDEGIEVQTTFKRLKECFRHVDKSIHIGKVCYFDPETDDLPEGDGLQQFLYKLDSYCHETEVRAIHQGSSKSEFGLHIPTDLPTLVENVYLAPKTSPWLAEVVRAVVTRFGLNAPVKRSSLELSPVF